MLLVPVLLAVLAITVHGRPQVPFREETRICSRWMTRSEAQILRVIQDAYRCAGRSTTERRGLQVRSCCSVSAIANTGKRFPTECGKQEFKPSSERIVGGSEARPNSWPWQVHLEANGALCGGTLIDTKHVLTAAHCISAPNEPEKYTVNIGRHDINQPVREEHTFVAEKIFVHEEYDSSTNANDIAIIRLPRPVEISDIVNVICLPGPEANSPDQTVWVAGWGTTTQGGEISLVLKQAALRLMPGVCEEKYGDGYNNEKEMCAGAPGGGHDSCQGDSGGPLMFESQETWYINGVVSRGRGCAVNGYPGIYTRVSFYMPWIRNIIGGN